MMVKLVLFFVFAVPSMVLAAPASGPDLCVNNLLSSQQSQMAFAEIVNSLHRLGLAHLTAAYDAGKIEVVYEGHQKIWQLDVGTRISDKKTLIIRRLDMNSEEMRELSTFRVAMALFNLQLKGEALARTTPLVEEDEASLKKPQPENSNLLLYYLRDLPVQQTAAVLARVRPSEQDVYTLLRSFHKLDAKDFLPARDVSFLWPLQLLYKDVTVGIGPNLHNYTEGETPKYIRSRTGALNYNYFLKYMRRLALLGVVTYGAVLGGPQIPNVVQSYIDRPAFNAQLATAPQQAIEIGRRYRENINALLSWDRDRLVNEIQVAQRQPSSLQSSAKIAALKAELAQFYEVNPNLAPPDSEN